VSDELAAWQDGLEDTIREAGLTLFDRVFVVRETASTQDMAFRVAGGTPGAVVIAGRQSHGRGRLGRVWSDEAGEGIAMTLVVDAARFSSSHLSLAAGLAAARTVDEMLPRHAGTGGMAIRWPNDVVERDGPERKIAGILIEVRAGLALVGIGINVHQRSWPGGLEESAVSLHQLGSSASRLEVAARLIVELERALLADSRSLCESWADRNMLLGRHVSFMSGGMMFEGTVETMTPDHEIALRDGEGQLHRLSAARSSLVHGRRTPETIERPGQD
jgi:BirA family transcriptional regulator, biotin operon repressor / biotin---[acetyl-CoA-carboxylase] ligase